MSQKEVSCDLNQEFSLHFMHNFFPCIYEFEKHLDSIMQTQEAVKASLEEQLYKQFEEQMQENLKLKLKEVESQKTKVLEVKSGLTSHLFNLSFFCYE